MQIRLQYGIMIIAHDVKMTNNNFRKQTVSPIYIMNLKDLVKEISKGIQRWTL